jgi:hypothetical protein
MKKIMQPLVSFLIVCTMLFAFASVAFAADDLRWETSDLYFKNGNLVIEGYFYNDTRTKVIDRITYFVTRINIKQWGLWHEQLSHTFAPNMEVNISPGGSLHKKFVIEEVNKFPLDEWNVDTSISYESHDRKGHQEDDNHGQLLQ